MQKAATSPYNSGSQELSRVLTQSKNELNKISRDPTGAELIVVEIEIQVVAWVGGAACLGAVGLIAYGFRNWRIIQLKQDQLLDLELAKRN